MVQAILADRKTQTRRLSGLELVNQNPEDFKPTGLKMSINRFWNEEKETNPNPLKVFHQFIKSDGSRIDVKCPFGDEGDVLWVRESWATEHKFAFMKPSELPSFAKFYYPTEKILSNRAGRIRPSIHMPKAACRIFLMVKSIRVERLQDISEEDAKAQGVAVVSEYQGLPIYKDYMSKSLKGMWYKAKNSFQTLLEFINGEESWKANPWVWVVEFIWIEKPENFLFP